MTGLRASPMRRRVCVSCQTQFLPKRLDAVTCSDRCRMAEHRRREARAKAESHFKSQQVIAQNTFDQARLLELAQAPLQHRMIKLKIWVWGTSDLPGSRVEFWQCMP
jgi:predicted nucleic acid-binding Zn ribbon protein